MLATELILRKMILAFKQAITVNDTKELAVDEDYTAVNRLGRQQVFACIVYD